MQPHPITCSIPDCNDRRYVRGWCTKHYIRWQRHGDPLVMLNLGYGQPAPERFWAKVNKTDTCWLWTGSLSSKGYGLFRTGGKTVRVHRWAYEHEVGPIPEGLTLDHLCRVHACVRPSHLEPVTNRENVLRGMRARND